MDELPLITEEAINKLLENDFTDVNIYNFGKQINLSDKEGIIQTFFPTTGTILLHSRNGKGNKTKTFRNETIDVFIDFISNPLRIKQIFD